MRITLLSGVQATPDRARVADIEASAFLDWLADPEKAPSTACVDEAAKLRGEGFVFGQYQPGARSKAYTELDPGSSTDLLCYDVDDVEVDTLRAVLPRWLRVDGVVYSTWKHTNAAPRLRVVVRLDRPVGNATDTEFRKVYAGVAYLLGIPADPQASDRCRFYFVPQHHPDRAGEMERRRLVGEPMPVDDVIAAVDSGRIVVPRGGAAAVGGEFEGVLVRPDAGRLKALATRLSGAVGIREQRIGASLEAVLRGERFAADGEVHTAMAQLAFELVRAVPRLDGDWFADKFLAKSWAAMGGKEEHRFGDWRKCVSTAEAKLEAGKVEQAQAAARYVPEPARDMTPEVLERAAAVAGGLVCEHRGAYYVFDPWLGSYVGPLKGTGLPAALRRCLVGVPGFSYQVFRSNAPPVLKSGPRLVEEYGVDLESVHYYAMQPSAELAFDAGKRLVRLGAYQWNDWDPVWSRAADELLRSMCGTQYDRVEAWLSQVRDLSQPLPALTLIGARGTWKSRLAQTLSRFWGSADAASPCDAAQVLNRFSAPLLSNPVIWSDEHLARSETGRAIPEAYRRSITELAHAVERKGVDPVMLHTATRHVISVNDADKVFGGEVDAASVEATIERYLVVHVDEQGVAEFEQRWRGTAELKALREGRAILEHVRWIEENTQHESRGRLFVDTDTNAELLLQARFADDTLTICTLLAIEALLGEVRTTVPGQLSRLPLVCDDGGRLRLSPARILDRWTESRLAAGSGLRKPTTQRLGRMLSKAGFKRDDGERAVDSRKWKAWAVNHGRLREFLHVEGSHSWEEIEGACERVFGRKPVS